MAALIFTHYLTTIFKYGYGFRSKSFFLKLPGSHDIWKKKTTHTKNQKKRSKSKYSRVFIAWTCGLYLMYSCFHGHSWLLHDSLGRWCPSFIVEHEWAIWCLSHTADFPLVVHWCIVNLIILRGVGTQTFTIFCLGFIFCFVFWKCFMWCYQLVIGWSVPLLFVPCWRSVHSLGLQSTKAM